MRRFSRRVNLFLGTLAAGLLVGWCAWGAAALAYPPVLTTWPFLFVVAGVALAFAWLATVGER